MWSLLLTAYGIVFIAELLGDKTLYSLCALATRFRPLPVFLGTLAAFMVKMAVAVLLGQALAHLNPAVIAAVSSLTFFAMAASFYWRDPEKAPEETQATWPRTMLIACAAVLFTEWADAGQIAAATLTARYGQPFAVWLGATLAIATKGALAITLGTGISRKIPRRYLRYAAISVCLLMGTLAAFRIDIG